MVRLGSNVFIYQTIVAQGALAGNRVGLGEGMR
jgi:hypothetical protein